MISNKVKLIGIIIFFSISLNFQIEAQLRNYSNQADYIIITPAQFVQTLQPFVNWRERQNMNVTVAELQQINSEFPDSSENYSIKDFITYALT